MAAFTVLLPQPIEQGAVEILEAGGLEILTAADPKPETVAPLLRSAHAVVLRTGIRMTRELLAGAPQLWTISRTGAGVDNVDLAAATELGIIVTSSIGANTTSVVEHALALILALHKQLPLMDREVRAGNFGIRYKNLSRDLRGRTLGVLGFGRIGSTVGQACHQSLGMQVLASDRYLGQEARESFGSWVEFTGEEELFRRSDVITVHIPLTGETQELVNRRLLALMRPGAFLVNTSRGGVVNQADLVQALQERSIAGAGLDVFEQEPPPEGSPLLALDNVILTPHAAALTAECVLRMATSAAERVVKLFQGRRPANVANPEVLSQERWRGLTG